MSRPHLEYAQRAKAYAKRVVDGEEVAGKFERLACRRFLNDLARQNTPDFPYVIDVRKGGRACQFQELLCHIKGEWAKPIYEDGMVRYAKIRLEDWQIFCEFQLFGWVHATTRLRRFRRSYEEVARKNAKSTRAAGRCLYLAFADDEPGAQVYSAATTGEQAREVFDTAREMVLRDSEFRERFGVTVGRHDITCPSTASSFKILNAEASTQDGLNVHGAAVDEVHAHKKRDLWDVIESADGARSQPLISAITTAGKDTGGICFELRSYTIKVLEGTHSDETWFGVIYTIDEGDDWKDPKVWRKANPNLGISAKLDKLEATRTKALATPSSRGNFLTKHLNVWTNAGTNWMDMEGWHACADPTLRAEQFRDEECYAATDLAEKHDFAAKVKVFHRDGIWYVIPTFYFNEVAARESKTAQLSGWIEEGHVKVCPGNLTDFDEIAKDLKADRDLHDLREAPYDPRLSSYWARKLLDDNLPMVEITQRTSFFTEPLQEVHALVLAGKLRHDGNPVMSWMVSNLVVLTSKYNELKSPTKNREEDKIDGAIAMLMALGRAMALAEPDTAAQKAKAYWDSFAAEEATTT
ncbi:terminase large subunit [Acidovorax sp. NCPPB 4044]|uniref:terminase large subunit n=1 Tax=Acidovorax sp. NCPPB 4044 TaxID=2940490 RepID=UPI002303C413|nr:terminase TerL endonuclease subunit [Acidovorax sp. NCPPB 4044]MDA8522319.1 terminase large subunit [Acidovorax sp. NCPPB 4044]